MTNATLRNERVLTGVLASIEARRSAMSLTKWLRLTAALVSLVCFGFPSVLHANTVSLLSYDVTQIAACDAANPSSCYTIATGSTFLNHSKTFNPYGTYASGDTPGSATVAGTATVGSNGALGATVTTGVTTNGSRYGSSTAIIGWSEAFSVDYLTVTAPGQQGKHGTFVTQTGIHGGVGPAPGGGCLILNGTQYGLPCPLGVLSTASANAYYGISDGPNPFPNWGTNGANSSSYSVLGDPTVKNSFSFVFGTPFEIDQGLETYVLASTSDPSLLSGFGVAGSVSAGATSNFLDTAQINGIQIFDSDGGPVSNFSIASASGLTYRANGVSDAPEPSSLLLLGTGLLGLGVVVRHRLAI